jgi:hypothetical protein
MVQPGRRQLETIRTAVETHHLAVERRVADEVRAILRFWGA